MKGRLTAVLTLLLLGAGLIAGPGVASAASILLYDDFVDNTDTWVAALTSFAGTHTFTNACLGRTLGQCNAGGEANFATLLTTTPDAYDLVILQIDNSAGAAAESALSTWLGPGTRRAIASNFVGDLDAAFDVAENTPTHGGIYNGDMTVLAPLTGPNALGANPVGWVNSLDQAPFAYGVSGRTFIPQGGALTMATLNTVVDLGPPVLLSGSTDPAIVVGNGGTTIINGFNGETLGSFDANTFTVTRDFTTEIQIYRNEISFFGLPADAPAVPAPAPAVLVALGAVVLGWRAASRRGAA